MTPENGGKNGWIRIDSSFAEHRKIVGLTDVQFRAHLLAMCWVGRAGTDGHLPAAAAAMYARAPTRRALVDAGLWDAMPDGSYVIHDWAEYQPPADPDARARWFNAERQRRHRDRDRDA